jgi:hypothetical protein
MKSTALQELVKKVFGDEETRLQFQSNPDSVLAKFPLTEQEKKAVLRTHSEIGLVTSPTPQLEAAIKPTVDWAAPMP